MKKKTRDKSFKDIWGEFHFKSEPLSKNYPITTRRFMLLSTQVGIYGLVVMSIIPTFSKAC